MQSSLQEYQKTWRKNNKQWVAAYRKRNKEKIKKQSRDCYLRNKEHNDAIRKKWYLKNKTRIIQKLRDKKTTLSGRIYHWKQRAKRRGIKWLLKEDDIRVLPLICHYTEEPLVTEVGHPNTISIDRIDSSKAYSPDNVVLCCSMVNQMKSTFSKAEFIETCKKIARHHE